MDIIMCMKKYPILTIIALILLISCTSSNQKKEKIKVQFIDNDYLPQENDWTNLVIEKDLFSHRYIQDYGDDSNAEVFRKNVMQTFFSVLPVGEFEFEGSVFYEDYIWDISLDYKNYVLEYSEDKFISACCDDIVMKKSDKWNYNVVFKNTEGDELYFHVVEGNSRNSNCILRPDDSVAATLIDRNDTFYFDKSVTEEEKYVLLKCIALYRSYIHYIWNDKM